MVDAARSLLFHLLRFSRRATSVGWWRTRFRSPPGAAGLPLVYLSVTAAPYLTGFESRMLEDPKEVDWERYDSIKSYSDPGWKDRHTRMSLAMRMMQAGMVQYVKEIKHTVGLFCVAKDVSDDGLKVTKSHLIWDARKVNLLFRRPPWTPLGSPSALSELELTEDILDGRVLGSFQGDVPEWFYRLRWTEGLAEYFALEDVDAWELFRFAQDRGCI